MSNFNNFFGKTMDANKTYDENSGGYVSLPEGEYKVLVEKYDEIENAEKGQSGVSYTYVVKFGAHEGSSVRDQFLFVQQSDGGAKAALAGFANLCLACGVSEARGFDDVVGKTIIVEMKRSKDGKYVNVSKRHPSAVPVKKSVDTSDSGDAPAEAKKAMPWAKTQ